MLYICVPFADRGILYLLYKYEESGVNLGEFRYKSILFKTSFLGLVFIGLFCGGQLLWSSTR